MRLPRVHLPQDLAAGVTVELPDETAALAALAVLQALYGDLG